MQEEQFKAELLDFIEKAEEQTHQEKLKDIYVTDHVPKAKQFSTTSDEDDEQYYNYVKSLQDYNKRFESKGKSLNTMESGKYERGSLLQRMLEPLAGSQKLENGTVFLQVLDKDLQVECNEAKARQLYEFYKQDQACDSEDASDEIRIAMVRDRDAEADIERDTLRDKMDAEFELFLKGEKYDFVTDLRKSFDEELSTSLESKILKTIPEHVFWDIKKPLFDHSSEWYYDNKINPARKSGRNNFFTMRKEEEWLNDRKE